MSFSNGARFQLKEDGLEYTITKDISLSAHHFMNKGYILKECNDDCFLVFNKEGVRVSFRLTKERVAAIANKEGNVTNSSSKKQ